MNKAAFDLSNLWPDFPLLFNEGINNSSGISTLFVSILITLTGIFALYAIISFFFAKRKISFYQSLISNIDKNELAQEQRNILNKAEKNPMVVYGASLTNLLLIHLMENYLTL